MTDLVNVRIPENGAVVARSRDYAAAYGLEIVDDSAPPKRKRRAAKKTATPDPKSPSAAGGSPGGVAANDAVGGIE